MLKVFFELVQHDRGQANEEQGHAVLTGFGQACDVARGSPAVSLLVSVPTRE